LVRRYVFERLNGELSSADARESRNGSQSKSAFLALNNVRG
jgi:hypothetical protein